MEKIATASRIHPLFAAAAVSVIALSGTGIAALTGALPSSKAETAVPAVPMAAQLTPQQLAPQQLAPQMLAQPAPVAYQPAMQAMPEPAPVVRQPAVQAQPERVVVREVVYRDAPAHKHVHKTSTRSYAARHQEPVYAAAPVVRERKPNYVAIGTGAVVGGLIGNQIGGGNGKKLATLAGIIGGGYVGNEIANRNK